MLEKVFDEFNRLVEWRSAARRSGETARNRGIIDEYVVMKFVDFGDGKLMRAFVCTSPNRWGLPAKDRSGKLEQVEPPDLGKLIAKLIPGPDSPAKATRKQGGPSHGL